MTSTSRPRTEPVDPREQERREVLSRVLSKAGDDPSFAGFAERFLAYVSSEDLLAVDVDQMLGATTAAWSFLRLQHSEKPDLRLYQPTEAEHGWQADDRTILEVVNDDMPFLVDSVMAVLHRIDADIRLVIHPVLSVVREGDGSFVELADNGEGQSESLMQIHLRRQPSARLRLIEDDVRRVLLAVRATVSDWAPMRQRCHELIVQLESSLRDTARHPVSVEEREEAAAFLRWLDDDHFTFIGAREYRFEGEGDQAVGRIVPESGLGVLRDDDFVILQGLRHLQQLPAEIQYFVRDPKLLRVTKSNAISAVHRASHLDVISVKIFDEDGDVVGEKLFAGLFTSSVYTRPVATIPVLRQKVTAVIEAFGFEHGSHNAKRLQHILENHPRDELFQIEPEELMGVVRGILLLQERQRIALFVRVDPFERFVSALIYVPRERFETRLRVRFQEALEEAYRGRVTRYYTLLTDEPLARLHVILKTSPGEVPRVDVRALESNLRSIGKSWTARLDAALVEALGEETAMRELRRFRDAFPVSYQEVYEPDEAARDIRAMSELLDGDESLVLRFDQREDRPDHCLDIKIFSTDPLPPLSHLVPMLERMGLEMLFEHDHELMSSDLTRDVWIRQLEVATTSESVVRPERLESFDRLYHGVVSGELESDGFNRLVLLAGVAPEDLRILRAYSRWLRQVRIPFSQGSIQAALAAHPKITRCLVKLFHARFDPVFDEGRNTTCAALRLEILGRIDAVKSVDHDRILRRLLESIEGTLRTNAYQLTADGQTKPYLSLKLDSRAIGGLPEPRPWREIWVHGPNVEAVHLRGGRVARGGIRYSDRREDFRTEVLGLMKAQMVKNAVIVPVGAKGGFVPRGLPKDRDAAREVVRNAYSTMMRGLLDLTDNLVFGEPRPPARTVCWDDSDAYLVVAADKGTATFSDLANEVAAEYDFWLGDAFASGGSAGYDHKKMGITARGAWQSVQRHFDDLGRDPQTEEITVVGVGDMSGDVFGNGMLLSRTLRLVAAFNHRHVFLDPDPDAEKSWGERKRLFELPGSSWSDYEADLISSGGGVYSRDEKLIPVSPEVGELFGIEERELPPSELVRHLLRAQVDLLWFGGIGTYVKSSLESDEAADDRANDALRIDGTEVRARVIGEGANLAITQKGRIECALRGCRLNTDFIDNAGGVDCSDHEVNIKVLLGEVERTGDLDREGRDRLLRDMEGDVAALVLRDCFLQVQSISVTERLAHRVTDRLARVLRTLEREGRLDRKIEALPTDEQLEDRSRAGVGFTRPEIAVLLGYAKLDLYRSLVRSGAVDQSSLEADLLTYFPERLQSDQAEAIRQHPLRSEIIATVIANELVNRVGITFTHELAHKTGHDRSSVALAYRAAREILGVQELWAAIEQSKTIDGQLRSSLLANCGRAVEGTSLWILRGSPEPPQVGVLTAVYRQGVEHLSSEMHSLLSADQARSMELDQSRLEEQGVPADIAARLVRLERVVGALDVLRLAARRGHRLEAVTRIYFELAARFDFARLRDAARVLPVSSLWDRMAVVGIIEDMVGSLAELTDRVLSETAEDGEHVPDDAVAQWIERHGSELQDSETFLGEIGSRPIKLSQIVVASRVLQDIARAGL